MRGHRHETSEGVFQQDWGAGFTWADFAEKFNMDLSNMETNSNFFKST